MTYKEIHERVHKAPDFKGTTVNERLHLTGLTEKFDRSIKSDKKKAKTILEALKVDPESIALNLEK